MKKKILLIIFISVSIFNYSCLKGTKNLISNDPLAKESTVPATVTRTEIDNWLNANPTVKPAKIFLKEARQATINGQHVVRIPIATNAALYFAKENGELKVYAYRWIYDQVATEKYTGSIAVYNFQTLKLTNLIYKDGKPVKYGILSSNTLVTNGGTKLKVNVVSVLRQVWCFLTGGSWISQDDIDNNRSAGANGELGKVGCDYSDSDEDVSDYTTDVYYYVIPESSGPSIIAVTGGGGGGWGPPPCPPATPPGGNVASLKLKVNLLAPGDDPGDDGGGSGCPAGAPQGQWVPYVVDPNVFDIINDLDPCRAAILTTLESGNNAVGVILNQMAVEVGVNPNLPNFEIHYKMVPTLFDSKNPTKITSGVTDAQSYFPNGGLYTANVKIASDIMSNATDIFAAQVITHETIHAYLNSMLTRLLYNGLTADSLKKQSYPDAFDGYVNLLAQSKQAELRANGDDIQYDHQYMANKMLVTIAQALKDYDRKKNNTDSGDEFYWCLAWSGLEDSKVWKDHLRNPASNNTVLHGLKYALTSERITKIKNIIQCERTGQPSNNVGVQGKRPRSTNCYE